MSSNRAASRSGCLAAVALAAVALPATLRVTRRDRLVRHETVPLYYGRLHFAH